ncbi:hypothetical protein GF323_00045 [Candidatus Woesearchaeota archaeon]|nr:hypothetical protein [Candidatus Woesearchaeota archaeon]
MQEIAKQRGGQCLSKQYVNSKTKLKWQCTKGHIWKATPAKIKQGQWCPICNKPKKLTLSIFQKIAKEKGEKCLSTEYKNNITKLLFQCKEGHRWKTRQTRQ